MNPTCARFPVNDEGRDFVAGDVHGCFRTLERALDVLGFDPGRDRLFGVGNLVGGGPHSTEAVQWLERRFTAVTRGSQEHRALRWLSDALDDKARTLGPHSWLRRIEPGAYRLWRDALARMPLGITVETRHGPVGIVHAESPHESWDRATALLESGRALNVALLGRPAGLDADEYRRQPVAGVRALVHGHTAVSEPEWSGNRLNLHTGAGESYLDQLTLVRIDVERLVTRTFDVVDC